MSGPASFAAKIASGVTGTQTLSHSYRVGASGITGQVWFVGFHSMATRVIGTNVDQAQCFIDWYNSSDGLIVTRNGPALSFNASQPWTFNEVPVTEPAGAVYAKLRWTFPPGGATFQHDIWVTKARVARTQAGADVTAVNTALGDANRVRFSRFEAGTQGWMTTENTIPVAPTISTVTLNDVVYLSATGSFTANGQQMGTGTDTSTSSQYVAPVVANERIFASAMLATGTVPAGSTWILQACWINNAGTEAGLTRSTIASGSGAISGLTRFGNFFTVPATAVACFFRFVLFNNTGGAAVNVNFNFAQPMVCSAGALQTVQPAFSPGPDGELAATLGAKSGTGGNLTGEVDANKRPLTDFSSGHFNKHLDNITDGSTYGRPLVARLNAGRPTIDFSEAIHANKHLDNLADGTTYGRPLLTRLSSGKPLIDFAEAIHLNKTVDNVGDGATFARLPVATSTGTGAARRALIDFTQSHSNKNVDNLSDGATYARTLLTRVNAGRPIIDFSEAIHSNKSLANVDSAQNTKLVGIETGANVTANHAAVGDANRVRFSLMEKGTRGYALLYNPNTLAVGLSSGVNGNGDHYVLASTTFTATGQQFGFGVDLPNPDFRIPVTGGERLFAGLTAWVDCPGTAGTWAYYIQWGDKTGTEINPPTLIGSGTGDANGVPIGVFANAPSNAVFCWIEAYINCQTNTGAGSITIVKPMVCSAGASQTVWPVFSPGPSGEYAADVTSNYAAVGDANRVRYSLMEGGTKGWIKTLESSPGIGTLAAQYVNNYHVISISGNFTAASQGVSCGTDTSSAAAYYAKVTPGERIFVGARVGTNFASASHTFDLNVWWVDGTGANISPQSFGTNNGATFGDRYGQFFTVPAGIYYVRLEFYLYCNAVGSGISTLYVMEPMICGAGVSQTVQPNFTPGPSNEYAATYGAISGPAGNLTGETDNGRPIVDFTSAHLNKNIDNVGDGSTYARILGSQLSSGSHKLTVAGSGVRVGDQRNLPAIASMNMRYRVTQTSGGGTTNLLSYSSSSGSPGTATISIVAVTVLNGAASGVSYNAMTTASFANPLYPSINVSVDYHVYVDDGAFAGGTPSGGLQAVQASTSASNALFSSTNRVYLGTISVFFPSAGSSGGSGGTGGGGSCVAEGEFVLTQHGWVKAEDVIPGYHAVRTMGDDPDDGYAWTVVEENKRAFEQCVRLTGVESDINLVVSVTTPITLADRITDLDGINGDPLPFYADDGHVPNRWWECVSIERIGVHAVRQIRCHGRTYVAGSLAGRGIATHNPNKP
jgi:hypothetical protein